MNFPKPLREILVYQSELKRGEQTLTRSKVLSIDVDKLQGALRLIPEGKQAVGEKLLVEIRFMSGQLEKLRQTVEGEGADSPAMKNYNTIIQKYALVCRLFSDLLPRQTADAGDNALLDFIKKG